MWWTLQSSKADGASIETVQAAYRNPESCYTYWKKGGLGSFKASFLLTPLCCICRSDRFRVSFTIYMLLNFETLSSINFYWSASVSNFYSNCFIYYWIPVQEMNYDVSKRRRRCSLQSVLCGTVCRRTSLTWLCFHVSLFRFAYKLQET